MIVKAAISPLTMASSGLPPHVAVSVLPSLAPESAAVRLFARCMEVSLDGASQVSVPRGVAPTQPIFVAEGAPAPVVNLSFPDSKIGPSKKIVVIAAVTGELESAGPETASDVVARVLSDAATKSLDAVVFDAAAADAARPAGLLYGLTSLTPASGSGVSVIASDLAALAGAISDAGVEADDLVIVTNPRQAITIKLLSGPSFDYAVLSSPSVPDGRVIAVASGSVASAYSGVPTVERTKNPALHFEDTAPLNIGTPGTPATVAAPTQSAFQVDMIVIKVRARASWGVVSPGGVAFVDGVNW